MISTGKTGMPDAPARERTCHEFTVSDAYDIQSEMDANSKVKITKLIDSFKPGFFSHLRQFFRMTKKNKEKKIVSRNGDMDMRS